MERGREKKRLQWKDGKGECKDEGGGGEGGDRHGERIEEVTSMKR